MYGTYLHNIDKKGRLFIPAKFREEMGEKMYVCRSINAKPCLSVYSESEFKKIEKKIDAMNAKQKDALRSWIFPSVSDVVSDASGRIIITGDLREYAKLEKSISIIGLSNHAEIWDSELLAAQQAKITPEYIAELIEELDI